MEKIFLIGGSGFVGKNLVNFFIGKYEIFVIDKFIDECFFSKYPTVNTLKMNLVEQQVPANYPSPDYIINLASIVTAERDLSLFDSLISSNLKILMNLYNRFKDCTQLKLFIQLGSSEEYGSEESPYVETMREIPNSPYALIKQLTVNTALMLHRNFGFPAMAVRPGNLFGPYQSVSKFIPYVIKRLRENKQLDVTFCVQKRDFIYVEDFAWCIDKLMENYSTAIGEIVNVASGQTVSLCNIIEICKANIGSTSQINYGALPYRENEVIDLKCSIDKLKKITGCSLCFDILTRLKTFLDEWN